MKKRVVLVLAFLMVETQNFASLQARDLAYYKQIVKELSSAKYQGRGYAYGGANKAGKYLLKEYKKAGVDEVWLQPFTIDINTFPSKMKISVDGRKLTPDIDFSMREYSPGVKGTYKLYYVDTNNYDAEKMFADLTKPEYKDCFVVCDFWFSYRHYGDFQKIWGGTECANAGMFQTWPPLLKFYKAYGEKVMGKPVIWASSDFPKDAKTITVNIENESGDAFQYYHTVNDDWEHAVSDTYEPLFRLVRDFIEKY